MIRHSPLLSVLLISLLTACAANQKGPELQRVTFPEIQPPPLGPVEGERYRVRNGDVVSIKFIHNPELSVEAPVRADGKISLPLVGEVPAAGLTPAELRRAISQRYMSFVGRTGYGELLKEGDELQIRFVYNPELNQALTIRPDGKISLPLLGDVQAAGVRPADLRQRLIDAYSKHIKKPDVAVLTGANVTRKVFADEAFISVMLSKPADQQIFVGGEVLTPRAVKFEGQITTLQAIMGAGGVKDTGDLSKVVVLRRGQFEQAEWIQTNLSNPLSGKSLENDVILHSGDVVVVPMTGIAQVDLWVKQYIRDILPVQSSFSITVTPLNVGTSVP